MPIEKCILAQNLIDNGKTHSRTIKSNRLSLIEWYYEQAMARHNDLVRVESLITERGYTLFAIYFGILTAAIGYILTHLSANDDAALTSGCLSIHLFLLVKFIMSLNHILFLHQEKNLISLLYRNI